MDKIALYRKYRPSNFDQVYGQKVIVKALESAIKHNEINHSYIFAGNKGSGKTTLAKIFSKAINCLDLQNGYNPCNKCANCKAIDNNSTMDFIELDAASNSGVAEVRNIIESVKYLPSELKYKVYVIDEAHMLTNNSWNALLKTIEEPPSYVVFIFATTEYHKIPATIISRCQRYDFNKISLNDLRQLIEDVAKQESIKISKQSIDAIAMMSDGAARDALSILDQLVNYDNKEISEESITSLFGTLNIKTKIDLLNDLFNLEQDKVLTIIHQYDQSGINFEIMVNDLLDMLMDKVIYIRTNNKSLLNILSEKQVNEIKLMDQEKLLSIIDVLMHCSRQIKTMLEPKFCFEYAVIKIINLLSNKAPINHEYKPNINSKLEVAKPEVVISESTTSYNKPKDLFTTHDVTSKYLNNNSNQESKQEIKQETNNEAINKWKMISENSSSIKPSEDNKEKTTTKVKVSIKSEDQEDKLKQDNNENKKSFDTYSEYNQNYKEEFFSIACHANKEELERFNTIFVKLKAISSIYDFPVNLMLAANKFLIVSDNGAILCFDTKTQAAVFNAERFNEKIQNFLYEKFGCEKLVIGVDKKQVLIYKDEFKKINKNDFKDVKIIKNKELTKTKLLEILNDNDKED